MQNEQFDVAIIGSGPAGLTAAIYACRTNLKTLVLAGEKWGGQLMQTTLVENYPGFPEGIDGPVLMENMRRQAEKLGAKIVFENVLSVKTLGPRTYNLATSNGVYSSRSVIIATGADTQWLGLPNEQRLIGRGVSSCATCDGFFFKDKKVAVVGGGDSAMEEALFLTNFASEVTIIHRRSEFRASKIMQDRVLSHPKIKVLFNTEVADILGQEKVEGLIVKNSLEPKTYNLATNGIFIAIGHRPNDELLKSLVPDYPNQPDLPDGLFIAGDVIDKRYKQAITAAAAGCQAAMDAERWLSETILP